MHNRGYHVFPAKIFGLIVPKNFVGIPSMFQKIWGLEKFMHNRGYHNFPSKIFCLTVPKNFVKEPFSVSLISGIKKFYAYEGNITIFYRNIVVSQYRKTS